MPPAAEKGKNRMMRKTRSKTKRDTALNSDTTGSEDENKYNWIRMPENTQKKAQNLQPMWSKETREQEELTLPNLGPVRGKRESKQKEQPTETQEDEEYLPENEEPFVPESIHEDRGIPLVLTNPHTTTQNSPSIEPKRSTRHRRPAERLTYSHLGKQQMPLIQATSGGQRSLLKKLQVCESQQSCLFVGDQILIFHHNLQIKS